MVYLTSNEINTFEKSGLKIVGQKYQSGNELSMTHSLMFTGRNQENLLMAIPKKIPFCMDHSIMGMIFTAILFISNYYK